MRLNLRKALILSEAIKLQFQKEGLSTHGITETVLQHAKEQKPQPSRSSYLSYWFKQTSETWHSSVLNFLDGLPTFKDNIIILKFKPYTELKHKTYDEYTFREDLFSFIFDDLKKSYPEKVNKADILVLDMSNIYDLSKTSLGQLISLNKRLIKTGKFLVLLKPQEHIARKFRTACLNDYFVIGETLTEALSKINSERSKGMNI